MSGARGESSIIKTEFIDWLLFNPIVKGFTTIDKCRDGTMNLEDIYKLNEICLYLDAQEREINGK